MHRLQTWHLCAVLVVLTLAAYLPVWGNGFVDFDDELYITTNPRVIDGLSWSGFAWAWTTYHGNYWQPLSWLSLQLDAHCFSSRPAEGEAILSPAAFHGQSLFWHAASVLLLFALWQRLTGARGRSFLVAALFAVHPMHVESVAWAAERKDVLSCFFGILTLWAYVRYLEQPSSKRYLGILAAFALSLLSKPMLMTLPFVLLLLDYWPLGRLGPAGPSAAPLRRLLVEKVPLFLLSAGIAVITAIARDRNQVVISLSELPLSARLANALTAYGWYVGSTFWPSRLAVLYPHPHRDWSVLGALVGMGTSLLLTLLCVWQARRRRWLLVGWLWFVGTLVPVIGLAQGGEQARADRFCYWPHIGLFVAVVWGLAELLERWRIPVAVCGGAGALVLGCLAGRTWIQVGYWHDTTTLWGHALAVTADNHRAHVNLGKYHLERGRLDEARAHFAAAVGRHPESSDYQYFIGVALMLLGREEEAAGHFRAAVERAPSNVDAWHNLGVARLRQGRPAAAARCFRKVLELRPGSADALAGLGRALWRDGERSEAIRTLQTALEHNPRETDAWHGLGVAYLVEGRLDRAIEAFEKAVEYRPGWANARSDLGLALGRRGRFDQAVSCHLTAIQLQDQGEEVLKRMNGRPPVVDGAPQQVLFLGRLGYALDQLGDRRGAEAAYREALRRDPEFPAKLTAKAWQLATHPNANFRDPILASELAGQAIGATAEPSAAMLDALAAARAARGQFPEAVRTAQQALDRASTSSETGLAPAIRDHLRHYQHNQAITASPP